jgi:uncharacterized protein YpbB
MNYTKDLEVMIVDKRISRLLIRIINDLENTQDYICGYSYCRTIRNILVGNPKAVIASNFTDKQYYGIIDHLSLRETEIMLDYLVKSNQVTCTFTEHGKMYCTFDYYRSKCKGRGITCSV